MPLDIPDRLIREAMIQLMADAPAPRREEASIGPWPYVAMAGGQAADLGTSLAALRSGRGREANPLMRMGPMGMTAAKVGSSALLAYLMHALDKSGHDKAAKVLGYTTGAGYGALAAHNARVK